MIRVTEFSKLLQEAKSYGISQLGQETGLSRSHIYGILNGRIEPSLGTFTKLLGALGYQIKLARASKKNGSEKDLTDNLDFLIWSLAHHGAPILAEIKFNFALDLEKTVILAIHNGRKNSKINAVLPVFIYASRKKINFLRIINDVQDRRYLAYLLNLVSHITNDLDISEALMKLRPQLGKIQKYQRLIQRGQTSEFEQTRMKSVDNIVAKTWKFKTADSLESIEARFKKWQTNRL